jgi:hypothetical protein
VVSGQWSAISGQSAVIVLTGACAKIVGELPRLQLVAGA